jgi:AcrR family transcriptional regulator
MTDGTTPKRVLSPQERRQRNREEMIAAILDAARAVMREDGVAALNLQEIARRVGMRAPSLYTYFPSKIAIYEALFVLGIRMFRERVEQLIQAHGSSWESIHAALTNSMAFAQEYPELFQLVFQRPVPGFVPSAEGIEEANKLVEISYATMASLMDSGLIAPGLSAEQAADLLIALMNGLTALHLANEPHLPMGEGRFGSLIPAAVALLRAAWTPKDSGIEGDSASA